MDTDFIEQFYQCTKIHYEIDYADPSSVKKGNLAAKKLSYRAGNLKVNGQTNQLVDLLEVKDYKIDLWVAHILLEKFQLSEDFNKKAIRVIENYAASNDRNAYGEKIWLEQWKKQKR